MTPQGVSKKPLLHTRYTRIVEIMWSNRGDFVERRFLFAVPENLGFLGRGGDAKRCKSLTRDETFVSEASFLGPPKISDFWGEQRPWSPADLVERYRLCDSSAECECKGTAFFASFSSFPYTRNFRSLNSCESRMQCQNLHSFEHC